MEIVVNGQKYERIEQEKKSMSGSKRMSTIIMMGAMMGGWNTGASNYTRLRPYVDLVAEYELIQQKKSELSRNDRDWVVRQFEKIYTKVDE